MKVKKKLKEERNFKYTVICFDLNTRKTVNDTYGHAKSDIADGRFLSDTYYTAKNEKRKDFIYMTEAPIMKAQNLHEEK